MVTIETFEYISANLDEERLQEPIKVTAEKNFSSRIFQKEEKSKELKQSIELSLTINKRQINKGLNIGQEHPFYNNLNLSENIEHIKIYHQLVKFYHFFGVLFGFKISYFWEPHKSALVWITHLIIAFCWISILYTQYRHLKNGEYLRALEPLALYGIGISGVQKWCGHLYNWNSILSLIHSVDKLCRQNIVGSRVGIINSGVNKTKAVMKAYVAGLIMCLLFFIVVPLKLFFVDKERLSIIPIEIPFCDQSSLSGLVVSNIAQIIFGIYAALATAQYGSGFLLSVYNFTLLVDLIRQDFIELDEMWKDTMNSSLAYKRAFLRNICEKIQDIDNFMKGINQIYRRKLTIYFFVNYFSQIVCLFIIKRNDWIPGYSIAVGLFIELMFFCMIGTAISVADDKRCFIIYNTNWYMYDLRSQWMIQLLLHGSQESKEMQLGPLGTLNIVTGIQIVKSIYTYYTVMMELL